MKSSSATLEGAHVHFCPSFMSGSTAECSLSVPPALLGSAEVERSRDSHLDVLLQLDLMLARQLFVLPLELGDEELSLQLLLVFERHQLLLQLLLLVVCKHLTHAFVTRGCQARFQPQHTPALLTDD